MAGRGRGKGRGKGAYQVTCPPGFKREKGLGCRDVNECKVGGVSQCGQLCVNTLGSYHCSCLPGYAIGADEWSCSAGGPEAEIIYSHRDSISEADIQNALPGRRIANDVNTVLSLDIHHRERMVFWIDRSTNKIERKSLDGGEIQHIVSRHLHSPESLAIDWVHNKIYWTDIRLKQIERCDLNGSNREVVFNTGKRRPRAIALDPFEGYIFWSSSGKADKVERVSTNGRHTKRISKNDLKVIRNLAIDVIDKRVYWLDIGKRRIESSNYIGKKRNRLLEKISPNAFGLAIFEQKVYWADSVENSIHSIVKYGDSPESRVDWSIFVESSPKGVCINHPSTQPSFDITGSFNCSTHSDCQIDLPDLTPDPSRSYLIYANTTSIHRIYADGSGHMTIAKAGLSNISTIEFDPLHKMVYFADHGRGVIERVRTDGRGLEVVSTRGVDSVEGMAVDWMHRRLYWVDSVGSYIATQSLYPGSRHTILMSSLDEPHGIAVHPALNIIYWSSWGESPKIEAARHDGSNRVTVAASPVRPTKLAIDYTHNKVLWIDAGLSTINEADLDGTNHRVINRGEMHHPFGLALYGELMWSTDSEQREVLALDRNSGEKRVSFSGDWIIPVDVHLIHSGRRVIGDIDPCQVFNGGCEQICIYAHTNQAICNCETGYHLRRDRVTCEPDKGDQGGIPVELHNAPMNNVEYSLT
nr:low-density lipoprotein receptor-related protein 4-like [Lytechinus pictus]